MNSTTTKDPTKGTTKDTTKDTTKAPTKDTTKSPTTDPATPMLDAVFTVLSAALPPTLRWGLKGWATHLRQTRHQIHAANSWAKHRHEFGRIYDQAKALTVARCLDYGMKPDEAADLLHERAEARGEKIAA